MTDTTDGLEAALAAPEKPMTVREALKGALDAIDYLVKQIPNDDAIADWSQALDYAEASVDDGERALAATDEQPIETAPKDGSLVYLPLGGKVAAYWCDDLERWVLVRPLHIESIAEPATWLPAEGKAPL